MRRPCPDRAVGCARVAEFREMVPGGCGRCPHCASLIVVPTHDRGGPDGRGRSQSRAIRMRRPRRAAGCGSGRREGPVVGHHHGRGQCRRRRGRAAAEGGGAPAVPARSIGAARVFAPRMICRPSLQSRPARAARRLPRLQSATDAAAGLPSLLRIPGRKAARQASCRPSRACGLPGFPRYGRAHAAAPLYPPCFSLCSPHSPSRRAGPSPSSTSAPCRPPFCAPRQRRRVCCVHAASIRLRCTRNSCRCARKTAARPGAAEGLEGGGRRRRAVPFGLTGRGKFAAGAPPGRCAGAGKI